MTKLAWLGVACALVACTKSADFDQEVRARKVSEGHVINARPVMVAPPGVLERRVLDLAACTLEGYQITSMCPAMQALTHELAQPGASRALSPEVVARLLGHVSPAVRLEAATLSANRTVVADAAHRERDPHVRQAFVKLLAGDARVTSFITDASFDVRREAARALASRAVPGGAAALAHLVETDPDGSVRVDACRLAGGLGDESLLPLFERMTASADPELQAACMEGLAEMVTTSQAAYRLFLRRVSEGVRPWTVMSTFCDHEHDASATWFQAAEVRGVLSAAIADHATSWKARAAAVESLVGLDATPAELAALTARLDANDADDARVLAKLRR